MTIPIVLSCPDAKPPKRANPMDAGADLHALGNWTLWPGSRAVVNTGVSVAIPEGFYGQIAPRSGLAANYGVAVLGGVIDSGYRGEIRVILLNTETNTAALPVRISNGDRIAQLIILPISLAEFSPVESLPDTTRGESGFGSTGS